MKLFQSGQDKKKRPHNSRFAKAGGACFYDSEVQNSSFVHLIKFIAENPRLRKAANCCMQFAETHKLKIE